MVYADYEYYITEYYGQTIREDDFPRLAMRASTFLDYYTRGLAAQNASLEAVKMACCALAEQYQLLDTAKKVANQSLSSALEANGGEVQSETVGSWSKSFRSGGDTAASVLSAVQSEQATLASAASRYLFGTGLLYRGGRRFCR